MTRLFAFLALLLPLVACGGGDSTPTPPPAAEAPAAEPATPAHVALFGTLPAPTGAWSQDVVDLGRMLYFEPRLSKNHDISCASCHPLDRFGQDGLATSPGHAGRHGGRNSPTTFHASLHFAQFWDGRSPNLVDQAKGPILNPVEMARTDGAQVVDTLASIPEYVEAFKKAFPSRTPAMTFDTVATAIAAFEEGLLTPSRFDAYLGGDVSALNAAERAGLDLFVSTGCTACHAGPAIGGAMYQKLGLVEPYPTEDVGRAAVTGRDAEKFVFKVPSLRNIARTGPYLHDGSIAKLEDMVAVMGKHQLGKELSDDEVGSIVAFLGSLTGEIDPEYTRKPELPANGPTTPKPDPS